MSNSNNSLNENTPSKTANTQRNALILAGFAVVATLLITLTFLGTRDAIEIQKQRKLLAQITQVVPATLFDNDIQHNCKILPIDPATGNKSDLSVYRGYRGEELSAIAIEGVATDGYSGDIRFIVGLSGASFSQVLAVRVLEHRETPGLGDKIDERVSDWIYAFDNTTVNESNQSQWTVKKDGGVFDAFTGATITPRALTQAVAKTALYAQDNINAIRLGANACALPSEATAAYSHDKLREGKHGPS